MGVSSSQPIPSSQDNRPTIRTEFAATPSLAKSAPRYYSPTMDDEAASQQLMSEARANTHSADYGGPAIPLSFDDVSPPDTSNESPDSSKKRAKKLGRMQKSHRKNLSGSPPPSYSLEDLQAFIGNSPSRSRTLTSTRPSTQIEVPDSQPELETNNVPSSMPLTGRPAVSSAASKKRSKQGKKSSKAARTEADPNNGSSIPATLYEEDTTEVMPSSAEATQRSVSQTRRRQNRARISPGNSSLDPTEVLETPEATQEATQEATTGADMQDGGLDAEEQPLTPRELLRKLKAERREKSQPARKATLQDDPEEDANSSSDAESTVLETGVPIQVPQEAPSQPLTPDAGNGEGSSGQESVSSHTTPSIRSRSAAQYCINGVTRKARVSKANPKNDYRRAQDDDDRTVADKALERTHELGHPPDKRTSGDFTADEKELLRRAIRDYQERSGLDTADLVEIIQWTSRRNEHDHQTAAQFKMDCDAFWDEMKSAGLLRPLQFVKKHVRATYHVCQRGRWSQDEDEQLRELTNLHPGQWKLIATQLNRLESDVYNRWKEYVRHGEHRLTKRWTVDEEENLVAVLSLVCQRVEDMRAAAGKPPLDDYYPVINWHEVCREMGHTRSRIQCQAKWKIMRSRNPPAALDVDIQPRGSALQDASADKSGSDTRAKKLGPDDMLWGDKFDLVAELSEQASSNGLISDDEVDWHDVAESLGKKWRARTLKKAFMKLCELVLNAEDDDDLTQRLGSLFHYMKEHHKDELEDRYHIVHRSEDADEYQVEVNSKKRQRQSDAGTSKSSSRKRSKPTPGTGSFRVALRSSPMPVLADFQVREMITDSELE